MPFFKHRKERTTDYLFQRDTKMLSISVFIAILLVILIFGIIAYGVYFEWF